MNLLDLPAHATQEEVRRAYRRLARKTHPDSSQEPDADRLRQLTEARDVALEPISGRELVTREDLAVMLRTQGELAKLSRESEATLSRVVIHHVGKLASARNRRLTVSALGTFVGLLLAAIGAVLRQETPLLLEGVLIPFGSFLAISSMVLGALALLSKEREDRLRVEIEEAAETLSDRGALIGTLEELNVDGFFTRDELQEQIYYWSEIDNEVEVIRFRDRVPLSRVAAKIGPVDFARILLSRGLETGMIVEVEEQDGPQKVRYGYRRA